MSVGARELQDDFFGYGTGCTVVRHKEDHARVMEGAEARGDRAVARAATSGLEVHDGPGGESRPPRQIARGPPDEPSRKQTGARSESLSSLAHSPDEDGDIIYRVPSVMAVCALRLCAQASSPVPGSIGRVLP